METNIALLQQKVADNTKDIEMCQVDVKELREVVIGIRIEIAKLAVVGGASGGGMVGVIGLVAYGVGKAAGWF